MKFLKRYSYAFLMGILLGAIADIRITQWQFYAITIPIIALVEWKAS